MSNRPIASLSPTLLARKGAARPAMRPQLQPLRAFQDSTARQLDDLGWNDMGSDVGNDDAALIVDGPAEHAEAPHSAEIVALIPPAVAAVVPAAEPLVARPEVLRRQDEIAEILASASQAPAAPAKPRRSALSDGRRAAFTLRLDGERHLKLRLACVTSNRSAQQLVTEALDRLIAELPDVAELAAKVRKGR